MNRKVWLKKKCILKYYHIFCHSELWKIKKKLTHTGDINNKINNKTLICHTTFCNLRCIRKVCGKWSRPQSEWIFHRNEASRMMTLKAEDLSDEISPSDEIQETGWKTQDWQLLPPSQWSSHLWHCHPPHLLRQPVFPTLTLSPRMKITPFPCPSSSSIWSLLSHHPLHNKLPLEPIRS